jgi:hypothetical protein
MRDATRHGNGNVGSACAGACITRNRGQHSGAGRVGVGITALSSSTVVPMQVRPALPDRRPRRRGQSFPEGHGGRSLRAAGGALIADRAGASGRTDSEVRPYISRVPLWPQSRPIFRTLGDQYNKMLWSSAEWPQVPPQRLGCEDNMPYHRLGMRKMSLGFRAMAGDYPSKQHPSRSERLSENRSGATGTVWKEKTVSCP